MRGVVWDGRQLHVTDELSVRDPGPGEVGVRVLASGICHSDLFVMDHPHPHLPIVLGHEAAGVIDRIGPGVTGHVVGEPVTVGCHTPCGTCEECRRGNPSACPEGWGPPRTPFTWRGQPAYSMSSSSSFAQQIVIKASQAYNSDGIPVEQAALIGCAVSTGVGAARLLGKVKPDDIVVVIGVGGIGVNAIQGARAAGAGRIVAVDLDARKFPAARHYGATDCVQVEREDGAEQVARAVQAVSHRIDVVIECSGAPAAIEAMLLLPSIGGRAVLIGLPPPDCQVRFSPMGFLSGKSLVSGYNGGTTAGASFQAVVDDVRHGTIEVGAQISRVWPLQEAAAAIQAVRRGEVTRAVLDMR